MAKKKEVKYPTFMSLADFAKLVNRKESEIMVYVKSGVISEGYCYPAKFGDGKAIAFQPAKMIGFIEEATAVKAAAPPKKKPEPEPESEPESEEKTESKK